MPVSRRPTVAATAAKLREGRAPTCSMGIEKLQHAAGELGGVKCGNHVGFFFYYHNSAFGAAALAQR